MKKCHSCNRTILFGGKEVGAETYCSDRCTEKGLLKLSDTYIAEDLVVDRVREIQENACPKCGGPGPNDLLRHYRIWSLIIVSSYQDVPEICCRKCGVKKSASGFAFSLLFGWWGFPFGLLITPIQLIRNVAAAFRVPRIGKPSKNLEKLVRIELGAAAALAEQELNLQPTEATLRSQVNPDPLSAGQ